MTELSEKANKFWVLALSAEALATHVRQGAAVR
jgi:hypothetical protein